MSVGDGGDRRKAATGKMEIKIKKQDLMKNCRHEGLMRLVNLFAGLVRALSACRSRAIVRPRASGIFTSRAFNDPRELLGLFRGARGRRSLSANGKNEMEKIKNLGKALRAILKRARARRCEKWRNGVAARLAPDFRSHVRDRLFNFLRTTHLISKCVQIHD